jgi:trimeric autotransporter adhesin
VAALAHAGGRLYAAGTFTAAGGVPAEQWVAHDGSGWSVPAQLDNAVFALADYGDGVVVAGQFGFSGDLRITHAGMWTGAAWQTFGQGLTSDPYADTNVYALAATDAGVYAGGYFDQVGPVRVASVAEWRDGAWHDMSGGVQSPDALGRVFAMLRVGTDLYVTGIFETAGGIPAANIARWDGRQWSPLGSGIQGTGLALAMLAGKLYVGGGFYLAGDVPAYNVAAWDPATETWSAVGSAPVYDGNVLALGVLQDRYLVVGGHFSKLYAGRFQVSGLNSIVVFDTHAPADPANPWAGYFRIPGVTSSWMPGAVRAMQVLGDDLYIGGTFTHAGVESWADPPVPGFPTLNLAVWRYTGGEAEAAWSTPGGTDEHVMAFGTLDGSSLVVGGWFGSAGDIAAGGVAEHDPATGAWTTYGTGIGWGARGGRMVQALAQSPDAGLWAAGTFTVAGGAPSCGLGLWRGTAGRAP